MSYQHSNPDIKVVVDQLDSLKSQYGEATNEYHKSALASLIRLLLESLTVFGSIVVVDTSKISADDNDDYRKCSLFSWLDIEYCDSMSDCWGGLAPKVTKDINWSSIKSVSLALFSGDTVSEEQRDLRLKVCESCELFRYNKENDSASCGVCGCKLGGVSNLLLDLTKYIETSNYGCKHPSGSRWKAKNC